MHLVIATIFESVLRGLLTDEKVAATAELIEALRLAPGRKSRKRHIANLERRHGGGQAPTAGSRDASPSPRPRRSQPDTPVATAAPTCPKCGRPMAKRIARKKSSPGQPFWGCSGFPACRFTMDCGQDQDPG